MQTGQLKRSLEPTIATQPAKHFRQSDVCGCGGTFKPLKPHIDNVTEGSEAEEVDKHCGCVLKGDSLWSCLERMTPNKEDEAGTTSKAKQPPYDEGPLRELQALERMKPTLESQAQCSLQSFASNSSAHRQWLPSSSFSAIQSQSFDQNALPSDTSDQDQDAQARYDIQDGLPHRRVPLGLNFQASVPAWRPFLKSRIAASNEACQDELNTDEIDDSSRWLGLQVWPLSESENSGNENDIGKGRSLLCTCLFPGSIDCIRLHIQEENTKLKLTLGKAYQLWKFFDMGESVSQHWSAEEQEQFKFLVKAYPSSSEESFWYYLPSLFPSRSMRDFVHYYFNVFVLQRRAIQNRVDPDNVDSDDDDCSLTSSALDESEDYLTDVEEVAYQQNGSEDDAEDESWQNIIEGGTESSSEISSSSETVVHSDHDIPSKHDVGLLQDDLSNPGSTEDFMSSSTSKEDALVDLQSVSRMIRSPQSISSWHHSTQAREKHYEGASYVTEENGFPGSKVLNDCLLKVDGHNVYEHSFLVTYTTKEIVSERLKQWDIDSQVCGQETFPNASNPEVFIGHVEPKEDLK